MRINSVLTFTLSLLLLLFSCGKPGNDITKPDNNPSQGATGNNGSNNGGSNDDTVPVTGLSLTTTSVSIVIGESFQLSATVTPDNATDKSVSWSSANPAIASVSDSGLVTGNAEGNTDITASSGGISATCKITVTMNIIEVTGITLNSSEETLHVGDTFTLSATVSPSDATDKSVSWSSSNDAIVTVGKEGLVTAVAVGEATVAAFHGNVYATCRFIVKESDVAVTSVTLNKTSATLTEGESMQLTASVNPPDATDNSVRWSSSNIEVATVSSEGLVTAVSSGSAKITATAGGKSADCTITVVAANIEANSITLDKTSLELAVGTAEVLTATVLPENATDKTVNWTSSEKSIATVDQNGKVTAIKAGNATITAKINNLTASCAVTVFIPVSSISLNTTNKTLKENEEFKLIATVSPSNATYKTIVWTSNNPNVATVDSNGNVKAVSEGTTEIVAGSGDVSAACSVTVSNTVTGGHEGIGTEVWD